MNIYALLSLISAVISIIIGNYVFLLNRKNSLNKIFFLLCLFETYSSFCEFMYRNADTPEKAFFWLKSSFLQYFMMSLVLHFILVYINKKELVSKVRILFIIYFPAVFFSLLALFTPYIFAGVVLEPWGYSPQYDIKYIFAKMMAGWYLCIGIIMLVLGIWYYLGLTDLKKKYQTRLIILGTQIPTITGLLTQGFTTFMKINLPQYIDLFRIPELTLISCLLQNALIGYAIWKFELFSLNPATAADNIIETMSNALFILDPAGNVTFVNNEVLNLFECTKEEVIDKPLDTIITGKIFKTITMKTILKGVNVKNEELELRIHKHKHVYLNFSSSKLMDKGKNIVGYVCIINDITERKLIENELHKYQKLLLKSEEILKIHVQKQTAIIQSMFDFANRLNSLSNLDDILKCILSTVKKFTNSRRISIALIDEKKEYLTIRRAIGLPDDIINNTKIKVGERIAGQVFRNGKICVVNELSIRKAVETHQEPNTFSNAPYLCSPIIGHRIKLGVINITNKINHQPFTEEDLSIISYISYTAAITINNQLNEAKLEDSLLGSVKALAEAIEAKDPYTRGHSDRVSRLSVGIAQELGLPREDIKILEFAGILHDIGKIGIPEAILRKVDKLHPDEYKLLTEHPVIGENILRNIKSIDHVKNIIRHHHERLDGSGYPDGLKNSEIDLNTRIIAVADAFDSMNTDRPYRKRIPFEKIKKEFIKASSRKLDKDCINALLKHIANQKDQIG